MHGILLASFLQVNYINNADCVGDIENVLFFLILPFSAAAVFLPTTTVDEALPDS